MRRICAVFSALLIAYPGGEVFAAVIKTSPVRAHVVPAAAAAGAGVASVGASILAPVRFSPSHLPVLPALSAPSAQVRASAQAEALSQETAHAKQPAHETVFSPADIGSPQSGRSLQPGEAPGSGNAQKDGTNPQEETASGPRTEDGKTPATQKDILRLAAKWSSDGSAQDKLGRFKAVFDGSVSRFTAPLRTEAERKAIGAKTARRLDYLAPAANLAGRALLNKLNEISGKGYKNHSYKEARHELFSNTDNFEKDGQRGVVAAYSDVFIPGTSGDGSRYKGKGDANGDGHNDSEGMNVEHLWPQSYFNRRNPMVSDLHHLMATFVHPNSERSRYPFGEVLDEAVEYRNNAGAKLGGGYFEPPDSAKGRVARGLLYFYVRYNNRTILPSGAVGKFWNERLDTLMRWNREFPPDEFELRRNDLVEEYQGNRNPFVDDHLLAEKIGKDAFRMSRGRTDYARRTSGAELERNALSSDAHTVYDSTARSPKVSGKKSDKRKKRGHRKKRRKQDSRR